ncbi:hypothetical protein NEIPOLOT_02015 [Neisseria polysaccharea ATCC 43768]|nr:hypothetical protein NEIPOLOT_02015 [Neisseria polysaccharea ATCC 43768]
MLQTPRGRVGGGIQDPREALIQGRPPAQGRERSSLRKRQQLGGFSPSWSPSQDQIHTGTWETLVISEREEGQGGITPALTLMLYMVVPPLGKIFWRPRTPFSQPLFPAQLTLRSSFSPRFLHFHLY